MKNLKIEYSIDENAFEINAFVGCILGTALGDAVGLPCEGLSRSRQRKIWGDNAEPMLFFGRRMISDDTEHTILVAQALIASRGDAAHFTRAFAKGLKRWFLLWPPGVGLATVKACLKLCVGISPARSGVASAGNGPAMRAAILGVWCDDVAQLREMVTISSRITHTDERAVEGAFAVALAAFLAKSERKISPFEYSKFAQQHLRHAELLKSIDAVTQSVESGESTLDFAERFCGKRGVSGFVMHTVPVALHAWLFHQNDFRAAVLAAIHCGGDTDSVAAIVGGISGAQIGRGELPQDWLDSLAEWPRDAHWMTQLAHASATAHKAADDTISTPRDFAPALWLRNLFLLGVVLLHGFRRLFPPY